MNDGELKIDIANGDSFISLMGWTEISLTRGIENFPSSFDIRLTEKFLGQPDIVIVPGSACRVYIGNDLVLTGYVDRYESSLTDQTHEVHISGRSMCEDLVDCSAYFGNYGQGATTLANKSFMAIAQQLCKPFKITVDNLSGDEGQTLPYIDLNIGETSYEILEKVARWEGLLIYDNPQGHLVFSRVGTESMGSGFQQGKNVQAATSQFTTDQRFTDYYVLRQSTNGFIDVEVKLGTVGNNRHGYAPDNDLKALGRYRPHYIISDIADSAQNGLGVGADLGQRMADWECNRRWGRSFVVTIVADSWRDKNGLLWQPNYLAFVDIPTIKVNQVNWIIASVTYHRDISSGTTAQIVLMPPKAFDIEPIALIEETGADLQKALLNKSGNDQKSNVGATDRHDDPQPTPEATSSPQDKHDDPAAPNPPTVLGVPQGPQASSPSVAVTTTPDGKTEYTPIPSGF